MKQNSMLKPCSVLSSQKTPPLISSMACSSIPDTGSSRPSPAWVLQSKQTFWIMSWEIVYHQYKGNLHVRLYSIVVLSIAYEIWDRTWRDPMRANGLSSTTSNPKNMHTLTSSIPTIFLFCSAWFRVARFFARCIRSLKILKALMGHT